MARRTSGGGTPATVALTRAGISYEVRAYEHDPRRTSPALSRSRSDRVEGYGLEAAQALGVEPARVFKTLLASLDGTLVVGIVPVSGQLDLKALARALDGSKAVMADVAAAERATGYVAGGISPVGQKRPHRTVLDASALDHGTILVSGGRRGLDIELAPQDLVAITGAVIATIRR
ncbi:Cys-tRNA(Pro) deacylase [Nocardioides eburneiflavus]|uniref:Cys-tRNA(Pro)/Cys-tRNA(Cys) deacylase n=1 Tax=Nocardioides eburneiflavus TaxID=2518372 RepID=A0A4Z1CI98_9ACTN|nr:Cys-tRNA(Pro) deacylase [Nocardioides eburneiflavus]TGN66098.1 Cys-tRNA(Pro) deacylase [Nocardioides eburneiflavus]